MSDTHIGDKCMASLYDLTMQSDEIVRLQYLVFILFMFTNANNTFKGQFVSLPFGKLMATMIIFRLKYFPDYHVQIFDLFSFFKIIKVTDTHIYVMTYRKVPIKLSDLFVTESY